jgi:hypothetical protein
VNWRSLAALLLALTISAFPKSSRALIIVHSNDDLGELEPCGCRTNPLGGYPRKANLLHSLKEEPGGDQILQLDAGDLLYPSDVIPELLKAQSLVQARYNLRALSLMRHDAVVPGEKDFALGTKSLLKLVSESKVHFLAANLFLKKTSKAIFPASEIFVRKNEKGKTVRIVVIGLVGNDLPWPSDLKASDPIALAKKLVPALRKKADLVIALTHEGLPADKLLADKVTGIDYIIGGHTQSFLQNPVHAGKTTVFQSSFRDQYIGVIKPSFAQNDEASENNSDKNSFYRLIGLDPAYDSPADKPGPIDQLVAEFKAEVARVNTAQLKSQATNSPRQAENSAVKYQTFPRCAECHLKQFDFWRKTPHMNALHPLVEAKQDKNLECLSCHTVGLGDPKGFSGVDHLAQMKVASKEDAPVHASPSYVSDEEFVRYLADVRDAKDLASPVTLFKKSIPVRDSLSMLENAWTPVQCENCHTPGFDHPFNASLEADEAKVVKKVENTTCLQCHTATRAPAWYGSDGKPDWKVIQEKRGLIACPAGDMAAGP